MHKCYLTMGTLTFTADGTLSYIFSKNFSYTIKTKPLPYSYIRKSNTVKREIYQDMTLRFIQITSSFSNFNS